MIDYEYVRVELSMAVKIPSAPFNLAVPAYELYQHLKCEYLKDHAQSFDLYDLVDKFKRPSLDEMIKEEPVDPSRTTRGG